MAAELAYLEFGDLIDKLVDEGKFTSAESRTLARLGLANYFAAATVLPYRQFHDVAENFRYDIERLSAFYSVSYETICHRLSTLQRPSMRGVPFSFVRVDRAGNMSKRQSATGFHFSSSGGTCPLWNVYETFANPGKILVQIAQMPDGRSYMWVARTVERRASRYGQPGKTFAIGLGCELRHAHRLVYSEGLDLSGDNATPIGAGCRVCERDNCPQRAFPALGRALDLDEHRSTVSPYLVRHRDVPADSTEPRIEPGGFRELGPDQLGDRQDRGPDHGRAEHSTCSTSSVSTSGCSWRGCRSAVCCWASASCHVATPELVILRVGHRATASTSCSSIGAWPTGAASTPTQDRIFEGPDATGSPTAAGLITATDEFVITRDVARRGRSCPPPDRGSSSNSALWQAIRCAGYHSGDAEDPLDFPD